MRPSSSFTARMMTASHCSERAGFCNCCTEGDCIESPSRCIVGGMRQSAPERDMQPIGRELLPSLFALADGDTLAAEMARRVVIIIVGNKLRAPRWRRCRGCHSGRSSTLSA